MWTYEIDLGPGATYTSDDAKNAAIVARTVAEGAGKCEMRCINERGGGYVAIYGQDGQVIERKDLTA